MLTFTTFNLKRTSLVTVCEKRRFIPKRFMKKASTNVVMATSISTVLKPLKSSSTLVTPVVSTTRQNQINSAYQKLPNFLKFGKTPSHTTNSSASSTSQSSATQAKVVYNGSGKAVGFSLTGGNNTYIPPAPTLCPKFSPTQPTGTIKINPVNFHIDQTNMVGYIIMPSPKIDQSLWGKFFFGSPIMNLLDPKVFGRMLTRCSKFRDSFGNVEYHEIIDYTKTIENFSGMQAASKFVILPMDCLVPCKSNPASFDQKIYTDLKESFKHFGGAFNAYLNINSIGAHFVKFGVLHSSFEAFVNPNKY